MPINHLPQPCAFFSVYDGHQAGTTKKPTDQQHRLLVGTFVYCILWVSLSNGPVSTGTLDQRLLITVKYCEIRLSSHALWIPEDCASLGFDQFISRLPHPMPKISKLTMWSQWQCGQNMIEYGYVYVKSGKRKTVHWEFQSQLARDLSAPTLWRRVFMWSFWSGWERHGTKNSQTFSHHLMLSYLPTRTLPNGRRNGYAGDLGCNFPESLIVW